MHVATELFHQRNHVCINSVGENLQESWERLLVNAGSDFHAFAVDRRHPIKCIKAGRLPKLGVQTGHGLERIHGIFRIDSY